MDRSLPGRAAARGSPPVGDDDGEPLVGHPLRPDVGVVGADDPRRRAGLRRGRRARGAVSRRARRAAARRWRCDGRPRNDRCTSARTTGVAANDVSSTPSRVAHCAPGSASVAVRTTIVPPPAATVWTPGSSVSASSCPSGVRRQTCSTVASSIGLARNTHAGTVDASRRRAPAGRSASPARRRRAAGGRRPGRRT